MEDPRPQLMTALKEAMKAKDTRRRDVIRTLQSAIKQEQIDNNPDMTAEDVVGILQKEAKRYHESIADYEKGGRDDLIEVANAELTIVEEFLPKQLSDAELQTIVDEVIAKTGATSVKDMGKVMGAVMGRVKGLADGTRVNQMVRGRLA